LMFEANDHSSSFTCGLTATVPASSLVPAVQRANSTPSPPMTAVYTHDLPGRGRRTVDLQCTAAVLRGHDYVSGARATWGVGELPPMCCTGALPSTHAPRKHTHARRHAHVRACACNAQPRPRPRTHPLSAQPDVPLYTTPFPCKGVSRSTSLRALPIRLHVQCSVFASSSVGWDSIAPRPWLRPPRSARPCRRSPRRRWPPTRRQGSRRRRRRRSSSGPPRPAS